jgi:phage-related protein
MAGIPKVKITFDADLAGLRKGVTGASNEVSGFGDKVKKFGKIAGAAFAAAGVAAAAYAGKLLVDGVKAAIEDEKANALLANTLRNVAGATQETIDKTLEYTRATELATGFTEDELRPSLNRLTIATGDVQKAMSLQTLALDISAGSGKSLEAVTNALAKAQEGNTSSLGRLGVGLTTAQLKTMSMDEVTASLANTFEGAAATSADTYEGKMNRLGLAFEDVRDTVGSFILDAITPMVTTFVEKVMPALSALAGELGPKLTPIFQVLRDYIQDYVIPTFQAIWSFITEFIIPAIGSVLTPVIDGLRSAFEKVTSKIGQNEEKLRPLFSLFKLIATFVRDVLAPVFGKILGSAFNVLGTAIGIVVGLFASLVDVVTKAFNAIKAIVNFVKNNPVTQAIGGVFDNFGGGRALGGPVNSGTSYVVGERGPELFVPTTSGKIIPNNAMGGGGGSIINLTVNGAIDAEGTARTIIDVLNRSTSRGTLGAGQFSYS